MNNQNETVESQKSQKLLEQTQQELVGIIEDALQNGTALHIVPQNLFRKVLEIGHHALGMVFELCGTGDFGPWLDMEDGSQLNRLSKLHHREYQSVFGHFDLERVVYGSREGQKIEYIPLDAQLQLPKSKFSYLLQDWDQSLAVKTPYASVSETLQKILDFPLYVSSLERTTRNLSESVEQFWDNQVDAPAAVDKQLVVYSADCKGIVMRKPSDTNNSEESTVHPTRLELSPKKTHSGRKKMAVVGAVYTVEPNLRTPEEVLETLFQEPQESASRHTHHPKPQHKYIRASMHRDEMDTLQPARDEIFNWLQSEEHQRNYRSLQSSVLLMDGLESLWESGKKTLSSNVTEILDILHGSSYVWKAAQVFAPKQSTQEKIPFVKKPVESILNGHVDTVIQELHDTAIHQKLKKKQYKEIEKVCNYFENNAHRMHYDEYLAAGYPIASGVIDGACRHVIGDRMEGTGMRWVMDGAQSMLGLRCIFINDDWDNFMKFHIEQEQQALYPVHAANEEEFYQIKVA